MAKTVAFHLQKGGVGKTTTSGSVAPILSLNNKVLLIDADTQGNVSSWYLSENDNVQYELADILLGNVSLDEAIIKAMPDREFYIIPTFGIDGKLRSYKKNTLPDEPFIFNDLNDRLKKMDFDIIIYDLGPGMDLLEQSVIKAIDEVVAVASPEYFSSDGLAIFKNEIANIQKTWRVEVPFTKIVCNMLNRSYKTHNETYELFSKLGYDLYTIPQDIKLKECPSHHLPIDLHDPKSKSIPEIERLGVALCR